MRIGKATVPRSAICTSDADRILVRGHDLSRDLIGQIGFGDYFHLLLTGRKPDAAASAVLNATLVAIAEHGFVPTVQAARMTLAAAPDAMQGAVAAGLLGCGSVILGASEFAGRMFMEIDEAAQGGDPRKAAAKAAVSALARREGEHDLPGYGHPTEHKKRDPRVDALFSVSAARRRRPALRGNRQGRGGGHPCPSSGRDLRLNVSAAIPAVLLGVGFPVKALEGRAAAGAYRQPWVAHLNEELEDPVGFALSYQATREFEYTGVQPGDRK